MTDPCDCLELLDFNNEEDLKKFLLRDKHTRIEGLFTEVFFEEEILKHCFGEYTTGWWFTVKNGVYYISKFTFSVKGLTALDIELLELFSSHNPNVFLVEFCELKKTFYYGKYIRGKGEGIKEEWWRIKKDYPRNPSKAALPAATERNENRLQQAIGYLSSRGLLKKYAIERMFVNCWLGSAFYWDIDYCVKYGSRFIAFEVKQKFPTALGTWGLNTGLVNLFSYLDSLGIVVIHVILKKPVNDASVPAIDLYMKAEYRKDAKWIATRFTSSMLQRARAMAPSYTSIHGSSRLSYYHLPQEEFTLIKEVGSGTCHLTEFLTGSMSRERDKHQGPL